MPIHPFECKCGVDFERITLSVHAIPDPSCPNCGKEATRRFGVPHLRTDTTFFAGSQYGGEQFQHDPLLYDQYVRTAQAAGVSINGKKYFSELAKFPGDPEAWHDNRGDMAKLVRDRGWTCEGLGVKNQPVEPEKIAIDEHFVDQQLEQMIDGGKIDPHDKEKHRDAVREHITPAWKKKDQRQKTVKRNKKKVFGPSFSGKTPCLTAPSVT